MKFAAVLFLLPIAAFAAEAAMPMARDTDIAAKGKAYQGKCSTKTQKCNGPTKNEHRKCAKESQCRHDKDPCECTVDVCACGH